MLHILWLLIKFILILLGIILGLAVLVLLLILFCPVRYRAEAAKETDSLRSIHARGRISWLFGAVSFRLQYREGKVLSDFRLLGIPVMKLIEKFRSRRSHKHAVSSDKPAIDSSSQQICELLPVIAEQDDSTDRSDSDNLDTDFIKDTDLSEEEEELAYIKHKLCSFFYKLGSFCQAIYRKLNRLWQKISHIPSSVQNIRLTIRSICDKIKSYQEFLEHPRVKAAISLLKDKAFKLIRHVFPTRLEGKLTFGSTDPSITGSVLALLGMTMPLHRNCIAITPVFEDQNILRGNVRLRGRIYGCILLKTAIELYFNKNIKYVIRRWKHK